MKWINVEKELPYPDGVSSEYVLIYEKTIGIMVGYLSLVDGQIYWTLKEDRSVKEAQPLEVTHWMPLPKDPKTNRK